MVRAAILCWLLLVLPVPALAAGVSIKDQVSEAAPNASDYVPIYSTSAQAGRKTEAGALITRAHGLLGPAQVTVGAGGQLVAIKHLLNAMSAPGAGDDAAAGYAVGSVWVDLAAQSVYVCVSADVGAAVWKSTTAAGDSEAVVWGGIGGTLSSQLDLQGALDGKASSGHDHSGVYQPADADLTTYAGITPSANVQSLLGAADYAAMRTALSLVPGTNIQIFDEDLNTASTGSAAGANKFFGTNGSGTVGWIEQSTITGGTSITAGNAVGDFIRWDGDSWEPVSSFTGLTIGGFTPSTAIEANTSGNLVSIADPGANAFRYWKEANNVMEWATLDAEDFTFSTNELKVKKYTPKKQKDFVIKAPADADDFLLFKAQTAITITDIHCIAQGGTSISLDVQECDSAGANCTTVDASITCDTDGAEDDGTLTNAAIDAGDWVKVVLGAPSGTVNFLTGSVFYVETAD